jgi:hypothetical protein
MSKFCFLTGDVNYLDYGGKWYRKVSPTRFHIIELLNMWDATGDTNQEKYYVSLCEVDTTSSQLKVAYECSGVESSEASELEKAGALHDYGAVAPLNTWAGSNANKLISQAKRESRSLDDPDAYEAAMSRPVNALGSTAREYGNGDFDSAIKRGVERNDTAAKLMAKIEGLKPETNVQFGTLQSDGGLTNVRSIRHSDIKKCQFFILVPDHYREDGSCKCDDAEHRKMMIREWGYDKSQFEGIKLRTNNSR